MSKSNLKRIRVQTKSLPLPRWVHVLSSLIKDSDFQKGRYADWAEWDIAPLVEAAQKNDQQMVFLQLGVLQGLICRLRAEVGRGKLVEVVSPSPGTKTDAVGRLVVVNGENLAEGAPKSPKASKGVSGNG